MSTEAPELYWDATYAIALALMAHYPEVEPDSVGLVELAQLVETLPNFVDDPAFVNERILLDIQITWYEEATQ
jgi:FeS assembly protein IscX